MNLVRILSILLFFIVTPSHADCIEGYTVKLSGHSLSFDQGFDYDLDKFKHWVATNLDKEFSLAFSDVPHEKHLLSLERHDTYEKFESFLCKVSGGVQLVVRKRENAEFRKAYKLACDKTVSIKKKYDYVYPMGVVAYCK